VTKTICPDLLRDYEKPLIGQPIKAKGTSGSLDNPFLDVPWFTLSLVQSASSLWSCLKGEMGLIEYLIPLVIEELL